MSTVYATAAEFTRHPTNLSVDKLIPTGTAAENAAELSMIMQLASSYVEQITYQPLYARTITNEMSRCRPDGAGLLPVRLRYFPICSVTSASWRQYPTQNFNTINIANVDIFPDLADGHQFVAGDINYGGFYGWGQPRLVVQSTYVAGYPNAVLTAACSAGDTSLTLDTTVGMAAGTVLAIYDGVSQENVTVSSVTSSTVVALDAAAQYGHAIGVRVSSLPPAIAIATIYLAAWMIKERRAGGGFVMQGKVQGLDTRTSEDVQMAKENLKPYIRVV